ncbi:MAG: 16S rRNA (guanine(527)-N(7))-methyltransferase RsmG [Firmicutes bacterium]|nr:16S rRNA (guanine(527)-N(7))-methyltransferase RsmG [Bacillota bacterium]
MEDFAQALEQTALEQGLDLSPELCGKLACHWRLLQQANEKFNITAIRQAEDGINKHYLDSLLPAAKIAACQPRLAADIGSGGGFPGLVLAAFMPECEFVLLEANAKKTAFLQQAAQAMELPNVRALPLRAETAAKKEDWYRRFDLVLGRAVAHAGILVEYAMPLLKPGGSLFLYKGPRGEEELRQAAPALAEFSAEIREIWPYSLPPEEKRLLCHIVAGEVCPAKYTRREGMAEKRPLCPTD